MPETTKTTTNSYKDLNNNIQRLNKSFKSSNSMWLSFLRGLLTGLGTAIGATIVAAIVVTILLNTIHSIYDLPGIGPAIQNIHLEQYLQKK